MPLEIKDIAGLGGVFEKLIQVCANAVGIKYKPTAIRNEADAEAYRIKTIAAAVAEVQQTIGSIEYSPEKLVIRAIEPKEITGELLLPDRAQAKIEYQEAKRQQNIESIISKTAGVLAAEPEANEEKVDDDWASRFFNYAQDVSDYEMQILWARILAGEVKKPKSFSLKTLELIRTISKEEADVFARAVKLKILFRGATPFLFNINEANESQPIGISIEDQLILIELGILQSDVNLALDLRHPNELGYLFEIGPFLLQLLGIDVFYKPRVMSALFFTRVGKELLPLIQTVPNEAFAIDCAKHIKSYLRNSHTNATINISMIINKTIKGYETSSWHTVE